MAIEYVGSIVLEVDGTAIDCVSVDATRNLGRKVVKTMNSQRRAQGIVETIRDYSLRVTVVIPKGPKAPVWDDIKGAKISLEDDSGNRESYLDCCTVSIGAKYDAENEARIDLEMLALDYVKE